MNAELWVVAIFFGLAIFISAATYGRPMLTDDTRAGFVSTVAPPPIPDHTCDPPDGFTPDERTMRDHGYWYGTIWRCPSCHIHYGLTLPSHGGRWARVDPKTRILLDP